MSERDKTVAVNTLMDLEEDGTSRFNEAGIEIARELEKAIGEVLNDAIEKHGAIDIRMFAYIANDAASCVTLERLF